VSDTLDNVTGRAWLLAELDRIATAATDELSMHYPRYRRGRTVDRHEFIESVEHLKEDAFFTARAVEDGRCDIQHVLSIFNWLARLDHAVHAPDIVKGRSKTRAEIRSGFAPKTEVHEQWALAFDIAHAELSAGGAKRVGGAAALLAMRRIGVTMTENGFVRAVREFKARQK